MALALVQGHCIAVLLSSLFLLSRLERICAVVEEDLVKEAQSDQGWLIQVRRELHKIPEMKYEELKTSTFIRNALEELSILYDYPVATTGIVGRLGTGPAKFALRADMDGLLIHEENTDKWKSTHEGKCHCCSHDSHMAMLLGAAKLLKKREAALRGTILLIFQPAEEGGAGAKRMVEAGVLRGVSGVFGIHAWPALPSGTISSKEGVVMAATDKFVVKIRGRGGHGGVPDHVQDVILAASMAVVALQPLISRELSPTDSGIVGITRFNTGPGSNNIHPEEAELNGTINALTSMGLLKLKKRFQQVVTQTVELYGCRASVTWPQVAYPPTVNDREMTALVAAVAADLVGQENWQTAPAPSMAAEDFAWLAAAVPGSYVWLGIGGPGTSSGLHTPTFRMDEAQLPTGAALHAAVALRALALQQQSHLSSADEL